MGAVDAISWIITNVGGLAGIAASVFLLQDRVRQPRPSISIQAVDNDPNGRTGFRSVVAVVNNPGRTAISVSVDPEKSDIIAALDDDSTRHIVEQVLGHSSRASLGPGASVAFGLVPRERTMSMPPETELALVFAWQPMQFRKRPPKPRTIDIKITRQHFYDLQNEPLSDEHE
ncbi:hypothetical protein [Amorphus coralli]|uniref:hypothetical protein n=1 Tax=Amorphus coralli TaxID=340680 RepID=UPI0012EC2E0D|nr:hypothetical protein [Amorphus coralli]